MRSARGRLERALRLSMATRSRARQTRAAWQPDGAARGRGSAGMTISSHGLEPCRTAAEGQALAWAPLPISAPAWGRARVDARAGPAARLNRRSIPMDANI